MNRIYRYHKFYGCAGYLVGLFAVDDHGEACLQALMDSRREVHFGEVSGEHLGDIATPLDPYDLHIIEASQEEIAQIVRVLARGPRRSYYAAPAGLCPLDGAYGTTPEEVLEWCGTPDPPQVGEPE